MLQHDLLDCLQLFTVTRRGYSGLTGSGKPITILVAWVFVATIYICMYFLLYFWSLTQWSTPVLSLVVSANQMR